MSISKWKNLFGKSSSDAESAQGSQSFSKSSEFDQGSLNQTASQADQEKSIYLPITQLDVLRYRYHHGANLGGIFVLEKWLYGDMFESGAKGESELDAVEIAIEKHGVDATRQKWESHWASALSESDVDFLTSHSCTSIRLPIGYFTLGHSFTANTPFDGQPSEIYVNAWSAVKQLCHRLHSVGIGTLLDLHALPGGANGEAHSGTSSKKVDLWGHRHNLSLATKCIEFLASEIAAGNVLGCVGLQICNESAYAAEGMYSWYSDVLRKVSHIDFSIPLYISDGWDLAKAMSWVTEYNRITTSSCPTIIDTHRYYTFAAEDKAQSPQTIIHSRIPSELFEISPVNGNVAEKGALDVVVGEWSCVLDGETWAKAGNADREDLVRCFGISQCHQWNSKAAGSFFWTAKMEWMDGGEWGFFEMTKKKAIVAPPEHFFDFVHIKARVEKAMREQQSLCAAATNSHLDYWNKETPGKVSANGGFRLGWNLGFTDAMTFFRMRVDGKITSKSGGDSIGLLENWIRKRSKEGGIMGSSAWEWEHGFRQGVQAFSSIN